MPSRPASRALSVLAPALVLTACTDASVPTYHAEVRPLIEQSCLPCHSGGDIAPFPLDDFGSAEETRELIASVVASGVMPPWPPQDGCSTYSNRRGLSSAERDTLLAWAEGGAPEGREADYVAPAAAAPEIAFDLELPLPEAYTPEAGDDDYRCQLIDWPLTEDAYVTALDITPEVRSMVHHAIAFSVSPDLVAQYEAWDEAEEGPGYSCYGGPNATGSGGDSGIGQGVNWLGSWVPGVRAEEAPEGSGLLITPGSKLVLQMHYNTSAADPQPDRSVLRLQTSTSVERPAVVMPFTNYLWPFGAEEMAIPAGEQSEHSFSADATQWLRGYFNDSLNLAEGDAVQIHAAGLHMHQLGTEATLSVRHSDGRETCLLDIGDWDFNWQGSYALSEPLTYSPGDLLQIHCAYDNTAGNQPWINGVRQEPRDVGWGDGTSDEMCLGIVYVTPL